MSGELAKLKEIEKAITICQSVEQAVIHLKQIKSAEEVIKSLGQRLENANDLQRDAVRLGVLCRQKIGELCPAIPPKESGAMKGKGSRPDRPPFGKDVMSDCRKLAQHLNGQIETRFSEYINQLGEKEPSFTSFMNFAIAKHKTSARHSSRKRTDDQWFTPEVYVESVRK